MIMRLPTCVAGPDGSIVHEENKRAHDPSDRGRAPSVPRPARVEALCERVLPGHLPIRTGKLPPSPHAELLPENVAVRLDRARGDTEPLGDLVVGAARRDEDDHVALAIGDRRPPLRSSVHDAGGYGRGLGAAIDLRA